MKKGLLRLYDFFHVRRVLFYVLTVALFLIVAVLASRIRIEEDIARMMPAGEKVGQISRIFSRSGFADKIVVRISLNVDTSPQVLTALADSVEQRLSRDYGSYISGIRTRVDDHAILDIYDAIHADLPVYLEESDYRTIDSLISPERIHATLENDYKVLTSPAGIALKKMISDDPVGISSLALRKLQTLQVNEDYDLYDGYIMTKDRKTLVMFVTSANPPVETAKNGKLIDGLDRVTAGLRSPVADVTYFGGISVAVGNARQSRQDTYVTLTITIIALLLFIGFFFRRKRVPFVMLLPVVFGALFSLAIIAVIQGHISAIAVGAGSVVLGIAINYSLHFFSHYRHCGSIRETIADLLAPMTIGSFTTVGSFFTLLLLRSQILRDFGLFAGLSLTGATIFALIFLPHFIGSSRAEVSHDSWFDKIPKIPARYRAILVLLIFAATFFLFPHAMKVGFDSDIARLNFMTDSLRSSEKKIEELGVSGTSQTVFIASTGRNIQEALRNNESLLRRLNNAQALGYVNKYSSISRFLPSRQVQEQKLKIWGDYWTPDKKEHLIATLHSEGQQLKFSPAAFDAFSALLHKQYHAEDDTAFTAIKEGFGSEYIIASDGTQTIVNTVKVNNAERKQLYAYLERDPATVILDKRMITSKLVDIIYRDFNSILVYTSLLVLFALLFSYGRIELTILTFLPMLISWIWILGIMSLLGIQFNLINIILSTFIFGIGDDFSIFITDGLTRRFSEGKETISSHRTSIYLSAGTTIIGLGALIFARHPAMHSIAVISIIGICCVLFIGQTIQPVVYDFFIQQRKDKGLAPWTLPKLLIATFAFLYFVIGCFVLTMIGYILFYLLPLPRRTKKYIYHKLLQLLLGSLVYIMANVRKVHIGKELMDFSKPAVIIANHQSFLDILVIAMQHPKLIMFTNSWTYHSPFFGKTIQFADYHPVSAGIDPALDKFQALVDDGYSIVIFPEGTRSVDGTIKRFHKGAFYLAEKLNLDIVPLVLHGISDTMRKGDFMLMNGQMTMKYLPRIKAGDTTFGKDYTEKTKNISHYFKKEFQKMRDEFETPSYFKERLRLNYIYKGPFLEFYTPYTIRRQNYYTEIEQLIAKNASVTVLGSGYGFMSYMLQFAGANRTITGIDINEERINIANNCYSKNERIHFEKADIYTHLYTPADVFVIDCIIYKYDLRANTRLFTTLLDRLNTGGTIIVRVKRADAILSMQLENISKALGLTSSQVESRNGLLLLLQKMR